MSRERLIKLAIAVFGTLCAILIGEALTSWIIGIYPENYNQVHMVDPDLGWKNRPAFQGVVSRLDARFFISINPRGLRGVERDYRKPADSFRVLVLGDSIAFGFGVPEERTFVRELEGLLNRAKTDGSIKNYEVINGGVIGYSTVQEFLFLQEEGIKYQPDLVILLFYLDDVEGNLNHLYLLKDDPITQLKKFRLDGDSAPELHFNSVRRSLRRHSALYLLMGTFIRSSLPRFATFLKTHGLMARQERPVFVGTFRRNIDARVEAGWSLLEKLLLKMSAFLERHSSGLIVVFVPLQQQLMEKEQALAVFQRSYDGVSLEDPEFDLNAPNMRLRDISIRHYIPVIDLTEWFRYSRNSGGEALYLRYDQHWTDQGHRLAAVVVERYVR